MSEETIYEEEYLSRFQEQVNGNKTKVEAALERAWKNRDFEIDKYWSRATYFWAFIAVAFAGYISIKSSDKLVEPFISRFSFIVICLGIVFSLSWLLVNIGSKKWQENWEKHIDMLEDDITGPLYKTVLVKHSYSVSRVNILVSIFVLLIWVGLAIWHIAEGIKQCDQCSGDPVIISSIVVTGIFIFLLLRTSKPGGKPYTFNRRTTNYAKPEEKKEHNADTQTKGAKDGGNSQHQ